MSRQAPTDRLLPLAACAVLTDFDGTLAPIVPDPEQARPLPGTGALLCRLAGRAPVVGVVSGRPVEFLVRALDYPRDAGPHPILCGVYGMERWVAGRGVVVDPRAEAHRASIDRAAAMAESFLGDITGARLEHKGLAITFHWRECPDQGNQVREAGELVALRTGLAIREGKMCVEVVPDIPVDKGTAAEDLLAAGPPLSAACFIGDDEGDLAAFRALDRWGESRPQSSVLKVAVGGSETPPTLLDAADLVLPGPEAVVELLERLAGARG